MKIISITLCLLILVNVKGDDFDLAFDLCKCKTIHSIQQFGQKRDQEEDNFQKLQENIYFLQLRSLQIYMKQVEDALN